MINIKIYILFFIFFFLTSCTNYVVEVGDKKITYSDIKYKREVEKAYMNGDLENKYTPTIATIALINDTLEKIVAQKYKVSATEKDLQWLDNHASNSSKNPELLRKIRDIFKFNKRAYYKIYLEPKVNNVKLRVFFAYNPEIHKESRELIWKAYTVAHESRSLQEVAKKLNLEYAEWKVDEDNKFLNEKVINIIKGMQAGELYKDILEDEYTYYILRLKSKSQTRHVAEVVYVKKRSFDDWFAEEIKKVPVIFYDKKLEEKIKNEHTSWYIQKVSKEK